MSLQLVLSVTLGLVGLSAAFAALSVRARHREVALGAERQGYDLSRLIEGGLLQRRPGEPGHTLVVAVHGWRRGNEQWRRLLTLAGSDPQFDGCDFLTFSYRTRYFSGLGLQRYAEALAGLVDLHDKRGSYDRVILLGYSVGGLIARAAYLDAMQLGTTRPMGWCDKVSRIVLLATPNRGVGGRRLRLHRRIAVAVARFTAGQSLRDVLRGSYFITNLRLNWVSAFRDPSRANPHVVQLLGLNDEYVDKDDSRDVTSFSEGKLFTLPHGRHDELADFTDGSDARYLRLRMACFDHVDDVPGEENALPVTPSAVVFELHGIRDFGHWLRNFELAVNQFDPRARVVKPSFGLFSALGFICPWIRSRRIAWFCDQYTEEVSRLAGVTEDVPFYFVGHSYGTYLFAQCLSRFTQMRFRRACVVGSVVPQEWVWPITKPLGGQLDGLRNDCSTRDWPVALCCQVLRKVFRFRDIGDGGFRGFTQGLPEIVENKWIPGNHSGPLTDPALRRGIVEYLLSGKHGSVGVVESPSPWLDRASRYAVPLVVLAAITGGFVVHYVGHAVGIQSEIIIAGGAAVSLVGLIYI